MLEFIYDELIRKYHLSFLKEYKESDDFVALEHKLSKAKNKANTERIEFYISVFLHHLQMDGSN
jgi:hypothetical protein